MRPSYLQATALIFLVVLGIGRIILSYASVSETVDEGSHIATGLEWIDQGTYLLNQENPPLPRVAVAVGPYLSGAVVGDTVDERVHVLRAGGSRPYLPTLRYARLGVLPFFVGAALLVWLWGVYAFGHTAGLAAAFLFTTLPPILGHAGLATTDFPATATIACAVFALTLWLERPSRRRAGFLGIAFALAVLSKFSALPFLALSAVAIIGTRWLLEGRETRHVAFDLRAHARSLGLLVGVATLIIWAGYQFSIGSIRSSDSRPYVLVDQIAGTEGPVHDWAYRAIEAPIYPAPELMGGVGQMVAHARDGRRAYLLGETSESGFWHFFPVALFVKTPLPFFLCLIWGTFAALRGSARKRRWLQIAPLVSACVIMLSVLPSNINIGLRYILPLYPMLCVVAGAGIASAIGSWAERKRVVGLGWALIGGWYVVTSLAAHPAYLTYFNELAGGRPEEIVIDSDLDWGQDVGLLARELRDRGIDAVSLALFTSADLEHFQWPEETSVLEAGDRATGWIAASLFHIKVSKDAAWLEGREPVATVGRSIRLYFVP